MLPGFRFLFAATILAMSILIFGLGAAALLRAAHEEFANLPSRRSTPEPMFARRTDETPPTLALLRIDLPEENATEAAVAAPAPEVAPDIPAAPGQVADARPDEPEKLAALKPTEEAPSLSVAAEAAKPDAVEDDIAPAASVPQAEPEPVAERVDVKIAALPPAEEPAAAEAPSAPAPEPDLASFEDNPAASRIATLGGPAVIVDPRAAAAAAGGASAGIAEAKPDRNAIRKRAAERARERRQVAARRARVAREAALAQQQLQANPFAQLPFPTNPTRQVR